MDNPNNIDLVKNIINDLKEGLELVQKAQKASIFLGDTRVGKTAAVKYLVKIPLKAIEGNDISRFGQLIITEAFQKQGSRIGHGFMSETAVPQLFKSQDTTQLWWDSPGLYDNTGPRKEIVNGFYIQKIFENTQNARVVLVLSQHYLSIQSAVHLTFGLFDKLCKVIFQNNIELAKKCTCLIYTKIHPRVNKQRIKQKLLELKLEYIKKCQPLTHQKEQILELFQHFGTDGAVECINTPTQEGPVDTTKADIILNMISSLGSTENLKITPIISTEAIMVLEEVALTINQLIKHSITEINKESQKVLQKIIKQAHTVACAKDQLNQFKNLINKLIESKNQLTDFQTNLDNLKNFDQNNTIYQNQLNQIKKLIKLLKFIAEVKPSIKHPVKEWVSQLSPSHKKLDHILNYKKDNVTNQNNIIKVVRTLLGVSQLQDILKQKKNKDTKQLQVFCLEALYFDGNLNNEGTSTAFISKNWIFSPQVQININLSGQHAKQLQSLKATNASKLNEDGSGKNGENGVPGNPGHHSGNFFGQVINAQFNPDDLKKLKICANGGNGGKGQHGGNGFNGKQYTVDEINNQNQRNQQKVKDRDTSVLVFEQKSAKTNIKNKLTFNKQYVERYQVKGQKGKAGGNAGKGGQGGYSGNSGEVKIQSSQKILNLAKIEQNAGEKGLDGQSGKKGIGSQSCSIFRGQYINEVVWTKKRKINPQNQRQNFNFFNGTNFISLFGRAIISVGAFISQKQLIKIDKIRKHGYLPTLSIAAYYSACVASSYHGSRWFQAPTKYHQEKAQDGIVPTDKNIKDIKTNQPVRKYTEAKIIQLQQLYISQQVDYKNEQR